MWKNIKPATPQVFTVQMEQLAPFGRPATMYRSHSDCTSIFYRLCRTHIDHIIINPTPATMYRSHSDCTSIFHRLCRTHTDHISTPRQRPYIDRTPTARRSFIDCRTHTDHISTPRQRPYIDRTPTAHRSFIDSVELIPITYQSHASDPVSIALRLHRRSFIDCVEHIPITYCIDLTPSFSSTYQPCTICRQPTTYRPRAELWSGT